MSKGKIADEFTATVFEFLRENGVTNLKIPCIGGKELNLNQLYKAVTTRGGFKTVTDKKLWKDIVNEFNLPASCTSASFTLKTHYSKYLLDYEKKMFFRDESSASDYNITRTRVQRGDDKEESKYGHSGMMGGDSRHREANMDGMRAGRLDQSAHHSRQMHGHREMDLKSNLYNAFRTRFEHEPMPSRILYLRKNRTVPVLSEIKRMMLAFESQLQDEIRYTLNSLLLVSVNTTVPFFVDNYHKLIDNMVRYLGEIIHKIPNFLRTEPSQFALEFQTNAEEILKSNSKLLVKRSYALSRVTITYEESARIELLEQARIIMLTLRNLTMIKHNDEAMVKDVQLIATVTEIFISCIDFECVRYALEIFSNLSKLLYLKDIPHHNALLDRLIDFVNTDSSDEFCSALETIRNLALMQENEEIIEEKVGSFLETLSRQLVSQHFEMRGLTLEILCLLSDLKMSTRLSIAKENYLLSRLVAILASGVTNNEEKYQKLAGIILVNLSAATAARPLFLPFERDLWAIASADETSAKMCSNILNEVSYSYNQEDIFQNAVSIYQ